MTLTIYRKYDLYRGLALPVIVAGAAAWGLILWLTGWTWAGPGVAVLIWGLYALPLRLGFRCPCCLARVEDEGMSPDALNRWERGADSGGDGELPWSPEYCGVCGLDFTENTYQDWPRPAPEQDRRAWWRAHRERLAARRPWWRMLF